MASPDCALARWIRPWRAIGFAAGAVCLVALSTRYLDGSPPPERDATDPVLEAGAGAEAPASRPPARGPPSDPPPQRRSPVPALEPQPDDVE